MDQINVKNSRHSGIKDSKPVFPFLFLVGWQSVKVKICQHVADDSNLMLWWRCGASDLRRASRIMIRSRLILLRGRRPAKWPAGVPTLATSWGAWLLWRLGTIT